MGKPNVGDVVVLNSGGPKMTVVSTDRPKDEVLVNWFPEITSQMPSVAVFASSALVVVKAASA